MADRMTATRPVPVRVRRAKLVMAMEAFRKNVFHVMKVYAL